MIYELTIVAHPTNAEGLIGRVEKAIKDAGANNLKTEKLGKKKLAYTIKKQTEAEFAVFNFEAEGSAVKPVWDKLRLEQEDLLRFMMLSKPVKKPRRQHIKAEVKKVEVVQEKKTPKVTVVTKQVSKVSNVSNVSNVSKGTKVSKKVDAKAKGKVASGAKVKVPKVSKVSKGSKVSKK